MVFYFSIFLYYILLILFYFSQQPVKGMYAWCQGCGHGGHLAHLRDWFVVQGQKLCPSGCSHVCTYLFLYYVYFYLYYVLFLFKYFCKYEMT
jgi:hypothetical protein